MDRGTVSEEGLLPGNGVPREFRSISQSSAPVRSGSGDSEAPSAEIASLNLDLHSIPLPTDFLDSSDEFQNLFHEGTADQSMENHESTSQTQIHFSTPDEREGEAPEIPPQTRTRNEEPAADVSEIQDPGSSAGEPLGLAGISSDKIDQILTKEIGQADFPTGVKEGIGRETLPSSPDPAAPIQNSLAELFHLDEIVSSVRNGVNGAQSNPPSEEVAPKSGIIPETSSSPLSVDKSTAKDGQNKPATVTAPSVKPLTASSAPLGATKTFQFVPMRIGAPSASACGATTKVLWLTPKIVPLFEEPETSSDPRYDVPNPNFLAAVSDFQEVYPPEPCPKSKATFMSETLAKRVRTIRRLARKRADVRISKRSSSLRDLERKLVQDLVNNTPSSVCLFDALPPKPPTPVSDSSVLTAPADSPVPLSPPGLLQEGSSVDALVALGALTASTSSVAAPYTTFNPEHHGGQVRRKRGRPPGHITHPTPAWATDPSRPWLKLLLKPGEVPRPIRDPNAPIVTSKGRVVKPVQPFVPIPSTEFTRTKGVEDSETLREALKRTLNLKDDRRPKKRGRPSNAEKLRDGVVPPGHCACQCFCHFEEAD